jgi:hypothetical protein
MLGAPGDPPGAGEGSGLPSRGRVFIAVLVPMQKTSILAWLVWLARLDDRGAYY